MIAFVLAVVATGASARAARFYDEAYTAARRPRGAYRTFARRHGVDVLRPPRSVVDFMMGSPLHDSLRAWPTPLVLSARESEFLQKGVSQRAHVLREFVHDVVAGEQRVLEILTDVEIATVRDAFDSEGISFAFLRETYRGLPPEKFRFLYGPDLVRDPTGRWLVLEDNVGGGIGGVGDVDFLREVYLEAAGIEYPTISVLGDAIDAYLDDVRADARDAVAFVPTTEADLHASDLEQERLVEIFKVSGVRTKTVSDPLEITFDRTGAKRHVFILTNSNRLGAGTVVTMARAFAKGKKEFFVTPGLDGLSNKALLPLMDRLARFYLGEELILKSPPTETIASGFDLARALVKWNVEHGVVKKTGGSGGAEVYLTHLMNKSQLERLVTTIQHEHYRTVLGTGSAVPNYVVQPFVETSRLTFGEGAGSLMGRIDLRPITYVGPTRITPPTLPWGRVATDFGNPRNNVSQGAFELVVLRACEVALGAQSPPAASRPEETSAR